MTRVESSMVVGVFEDRSLAEQAIYELRSTGFSHEQLGFIEHDMGTDAADSIIGAFTSMGVPEEEVHYYHDEFKAGRINVTVKAANRYQEALDILHHNGASLASRRNIPPDRRHATIKPGEKKSKSNPTKKTGKSNPTKKTGKSRPSGQIITSPRLSGPSVVPRPVSSDPVCGEQEPTET